jgi:hypothetical protein
MTDSESKQEESCLYCHTNTARKVAHDGSATDKDIGDLCGRCAYFEKVLADRIAAGHLPMTLIVGLMTRLSQHDRARTIKKIVNSHLTYYDWVIDTVLPIPDLPGPLRD